MIVNTSRPSSKSNAHIFRKYKIVIHLLLIFLFSLSSGQLRANSDKDTLCSALKNQETKQDCLNFVDDNPGNYHVKILNDKDSLKSLKPESYTIYILNNYSYSINAPVTFKNVDHIGFFGGRKDSPPFIIMATAFGVPRKDVRKFDFKNCYKCVISYFDLEAGNHPDSKKDPASIKSNKAVLIKGSKSEVEIKNITINNFDENGYIRADNAASVTLSKFYIRNWDFSDQNLLTHLIDLDQCDNIKLDDVRFSNFDLSTLTSSLKRGALRISDPVNFRILNTKMNMKRNSQPLKNGDAINISFTDVKAPRNQPVDGVISKLNISMDGNDEWPDQWRGIVLSLKGQDPEKGEPNSNIKGAISIISSIIPGGNKVFNTDLFPLLTIKFSSLASIIHSSSPLSALTTTGYYATASETASDSSFYLSSTPSLLSVLTTPAASTTQQLRMTSPSDENKASVTSSRPPVKSSISSHYPDLTSSNIATLSSNKATIHTQPSTPFAPVRTPMPSPATIIGTITTRSPSSSRINQTSAVTTPFARGYFTSSLPLNKQAHGSNSKDKIIVGTTTTIGSLVILTSILTVIYCKKRRGGEVRYEAMHMGEP